MDKLFIKTVDVRSREEGDDFAIVTYANLKGRANRISNDPEVAEELKGTWIEGKIQKAKVVPYPADFGDGKGEKMVSVRNVVIFEGETLEEAVKAAGRKLAPSEDAVKAKALQSEDAVLS